MRSRSVRAEHRVVTRRVRLVNATDCLGAKLSASSSHRSQRRIAHAASSTSPTRCKRRTCAAARRWPSRAAGATACAKAPSLAVNAASHRCRSASPRSPKVERARRQPLSHRHRARARRSRPTRSESSQNHRRAPNSLNVARSFVPPALPLNRVASAALPLTIAERRPNVADGALLGGLSNHRERSTLSSPTKHRRTSGCCSRLATTEESSFCFCRGFS